RDLARSRRSDGDRGGRRPRLSGGHGEITALSGQGGAEGATQGLREVTDGMECQEARPLFLDYQRGQLTPARHDEVRAHLERCARCAREEAAERALTNLVERNLPQYPAPLALKRRLAAHWPAPGVARHSWWSGWRRALAPAVALAAVLVAGVSLLDIERVIWRPSMLPARWSPRQSTITCGFSRASIRWRLRAAGSIRSSPGSLAAWTSRRSSDSRAMRTSRCAAGPWATSSIARPRSSSTAAACIRSRSSSSVPMGSRGRRAACNGSAALTRP